MSQKNRPKKTTVKSASNGGFVHEIETTSQCQSSNYDRMPLEQTLKSDTKLSSANHDKIVISTESVQKQSIDLIEPVAEDPPEMIQSTIFEPQVNDTNAIDSDSIEMKSIVKSSHEENDSKPKNVTENKPSQKNYHLDHSKLNEISSVDDVRHTIIECREPNGTTYFVEADPTVEAEHKSNGIVNGSLDSNASTDDTNHLDQSYELTELQKIELEMNILERVLNRTDIELTPKQVPAIVSTNNVSAIATNAPSDDDFISDDDSSVDEDEREVRVIVHASNSRSNSPIYTPPPTPISPRPTPIVQHKHHTFEKHSPAGRTPNFRIGTYESTPKHKLLYENDQSRRAFKVHLENLFSQYDESNRSPYVTKLRHAERLTPYNTRLNHSLSAPESLVVSMADELAETKSELMTMSLSPTTTTTTTIANDCSPSEIPPPPMFNQQLYDTIGRRNRKVFALTDEVIDIDGGDLREHHASKSAPQTLQKSKLQRAKAHENLAQLDSEFTDDNYDTDNDSHTNDNDSNDDDDEPLNVSSIREKLEQIFSRGRTTQADVIDLELNQNENVRQSKRHELFDTVRMQKMRFSSVLKTIESIGPDLHANLHPTNTTAANDIQQEVERREAMTDVHNSEMNEKSEDHELSAVADETSTETTPTQIKSIV